MVVVPVLAALIVLVPLAALVVLVPPAALAIAAPPPTAAPISASVVNSIGIRLRISPPFIVRRSWVSPDDPPAK